MTGNPKYKMFKLYDKKGFLKLITSDKRIYNHYLVHMMGAKQDRQIREGSGESKP